MALWALTCTGSFNGLEKVYGEGLEACDYLTVDSLGHYISYRLFNLFFYHGHDHSHVERCSPEGGELEGSAIRRHMPEVIHEPHNIQIANIAMSSSQ